MRFPVTSFRRSRDSGFSYTTTTNIYFFLLSNPQPPTPNLQPPTSNPHPTPTQPPTQPSMATDQDDSICEWESDDDGYTSNDLNFFDLIDHVSNALESVTGQIQKGQKELLYKSQEFKDKTTKAWHTQRAQLERRRAKLQTRLETLHTRFTSDQKVVRIRDKVSFVVGVGNACLSPWMAAKYPEWVPHWYTLQALYLIPLRFFIYKSRSWHYFVYDLCYFVNVLTVLWLYVFPSSQWLFISLFCLTHGPIAWAIIAWRNSFVFHSMDKVTSLFIHIFPPFALYTVRWLHPDIGARNAQYPALEELETLDFTRALQFSFAVYSVWQLLYYIFIVVGRRDKVEKGLRATSYSWLLNDPRNQGGLFSRVANTFGPKNKYTIELEKLQKERKEIKREIDDGTVVASGDEGLRNRVKMEN
ncbi:hypothetical protein BC936DRAFT_146843 [Jimgerdemannia flammicorona]|uniref:Glycerophosphocholine acyltransferase 1 n=1 Tax=Jimgerdemannia flammicorona TaxID=994334 RepID=A0A433D6S2_9FUNG|nr:hypothetical protein BC936DRAFT_146843 [Jimgerdemannia flammicorona]